MTQMDVKLIVSENGRQMEVIRMFACNSCETVARLELSGGASDLKQALQAIAALAADPATHVSRIGRGPFPRWLEEKR